MPVTVINQTGEMGRIVNWISAAWIDIQSAHQDWEWMKASCSFPTVAGQALYSPTTDIGLTDFGMWDQDSFRVYQTSAGLGSEAFLAYSEWDDWRDTYQKGTARTSQSQPFEITVSPNKSLGLGSVPSAGYTVLGDYYKVPAEMAANTDTPTMPTQFHMAIVYRAMMLYGSYEAAAEKYQHGQIEFNKMFRRLELDQLQPMQRPEPLA